MHIEVDKAAIETVLDSDGWRRRGYGCAIDSARAVRFPA